jgi:hypothetical protein
MVRTLEQDQRKNKRDVKRIIENKILCDVPGCDELVSLYRGPYSDTKCRDHQLQGIEYGGNASASRKYTYHKLDHCEGVDIIRTLTQKDLILTTLKMSMI